MMNRSRLGLLVIAIIAIILIVAVAWMFISPPQACITDTEWTLVSYGSKSNPQKALPDVKATATFSEGKITGIASCNNYFTSYEIDGILIENNLSNWNYTDDVRRECNAARKSIFRSFRNFKVL